MSKQFGALLKQHRFAMGKTLREFCLEHGLNPGNYSKLERGKLPPPQGSELIEKYAAALGLERGSDAWLELFDVASAERGEIPQDLMSDEEVVDKLPMVFRTIRGKPVSDEQLKEFVELVRRS